MLIGALRRALSSQLLRSSSSSAPSPWIDSGLSFACTSCGECCRGNTNVYLNPAETLALAEHLSMSEDAFLSTYTKDSLTSRGFQTSLVSKVVAQRKQCVFLTGNLCSVYEVRPTQCRTYPFWPQFMVSKSEWDAEQTRCEGINSSSPSALVSGATAMESLVVHQVHDRGLGADYLHDDAIDLLRQSEIQTPGLIQEYTDEYFLTHGTSTVYESAHCRVIDIHLVESDADGEDVNAIYRRLEFITSPRMTQTEIRIQSDGSINFTSLVMSVHAVMAAISLSHLHATSSSIEVSKVAVIGAGCCALPMHIATVSRMPLLIDAIEPDEEVLHLAEKYFGADFSTNNIWQMRRHVCDGLTYIHRSLHSSFSVLIVDAFDSHVNDIGGQAPPLSLSSEAFFHTALTTLTNNGLLLINVIGSLDWAQRLHSIANAAMKTEHDQVALVRVDGSDNYVLVVRTSTSALTQSIADVVKDAIDG